MLGDELGALQNRVIKNSSAQKQSHTQRYLCNVETAGKDVCSEASFVIELKNSQNSIKNLQYAEYS